MDLTGEIRLQRIESGQAGLDSDGERKILAPGGFFSKSAAVAIFLSQRGDFKLKFRHTVDVLHNMSAS